MFNDIIRKGRQPFSVLTRLKSRHDTAFAVLHPQVEITKASPTVQIATSVGITGLIVTGNFVAAAATAGAWIGSKPLAHIVASGLACVGEVDAALRKATAGLDRATESDAEAKPKMPRRRNRRQPRVAAVPAG